MSFSARPVFGAAIFLWVVACGGTSASHGGGDGMAGMSGSGGSSGTAGNSGHAGTGAKGGSGGSSGSTAGSGTGGNGAFSGSGGASGSCGQVGCPDTPPNNGDACSLCAVPPSCSWDERPVDGPLYTATCMNDRWQVDMQWAYCCKTNADCGTGVCVKSACKQAASDHCWTDAQCSAGYVCSGAAVCECGQLCGAPDQAGTCVPKDRNCCVADTDCADGSECVQGVCKEQLTGFACWATRDCVGGICVAPNVCPCGSDCLVPDAAGNCAFP